MEDAKIREITFSDFPAKGAMVDGRINALGDHGETGVTQLDPDPMIEREDAKWPRLALEHAYQADESTAERGTGTLRSRHNFEA